jgi:hypothetical protein
MHISARLWSAQAVTGEEVVQIFGVDITGDHARLILTAVGTLLASAGFIAVAGRDTAAG